MKKSKKSSTEKNDLLENMVKLAKSDKKDNYLMASAIPPQTGYVNSWGGVSISSEELKVGVKPEFLPQAYKTILTFDTSAIPKDARITYVNLCILPDSDEYQYIADNLSIELAGGAGFGGSYFITGMDYYDPFPWQHYYHSLFNVKRETLSPITWNAAIGGIVLHIDGTSGDFIDLTNALRHEKTQMRISFKQNPENYLVNFNGFGSDEFKEQATLFVAWE